VIERLVFLAKIEKGLGQAEQGKTLSQQDVAKRFKR